MGRTAAPRHRIRALVIVQNLSVPTDRRVWMECQALVAAGFGVSVICPREADEPPSRQLDGVWIHTYRPPRATSGLLSYIAEFVYCWLRTAALSVRVLRREGFDVIQTCNPPDTYWLLGLLYRPLRKRFVYDQHDLCPEVYEARFGKRGLLYHALRLLERANYAVADHVITTNGSYREVALRRGRCDPKDISVVMSCPDPQRMCPGEPEPQLRGDREHLCCYLGIMGPQDGVDRLLHAIAHYVHTLGRRDCHFALLGFGDSLPSLQELAEELDVSPWVTFTGRVGPEEIRRYLSTADVGVAPDPMSEFNHRSTMNKTLEYMAHAVPVLAFALRETRTTVGDAGMFVPVDDDAAFAEALAGLIDEPETRAGMGKRGRARIEGELSWKHQAPVYVSAFRRLTGTVTSTAAEPDPAGDAAAAAGNGYAPGSPDRTSAPAGVRVDGAVRQTDATQHATQQRQSRQNGVPVASRSGRTGRAPIDVGESE